MTELLAGGVIKLEKVYTLVQDIYAVGSNHAPKSRDKKT